MIIISSTNENIAFIAEQIKKGTLVDKDTIKAAVFECLGENVEMFKPAFDFDRNGKVEGTEKLMFEYFKEIIKTTQSHQEKTVKDTQKYSFWNILVNAVFLLSACLPYIIQAWRG